MTQNPVALCNPFSMGFDRLETIEIHTGTDPKALHSTFLTTHFGETVPQGGLFAYLFRRFGFPNRGSDPHKELATYLLSTHKSDLFVMITPYAGGDVDIGFRFLAPQNVAKTIRIWEERDMEAHRQAEQEALLAQTPEWADAWITRCQTNNSLFPHEIPQNRPWTFADTLPALHRLAWKESQNPSPESQWILDQSHAFRLKNPWPGRLLRNADPDTWSDDDPLKPYAQAARNTLLDLKRPVWVRDVPINPWGQVEDDDVPLDDEGEPLETDRAPSSGYPGGDLCNADPKLFAALHSAIVKLGQGNPQIGLQEALKRLTTSTPPCDDT